MLKKKKNFLRYSNLITFPLKKKFNQNTKKMLTNLHLDLLLKGEKVVECLLIIF